MMNTDNLLLTLAWLGEVSTAHIQRLYMPGYRAQRQFSCLRVLQELRSEGYVARRMWSIQHAGRGAYLRQSALCP